MNALQWKVLGGAALAILLTGLLANQVRTCQNTRATQAEHNASVAQGEANAHATQAKTSDAAVSDLQAKLQDQSASLDRLLKERAALLRKLAKNPIPNDVAMPSDPGAPPSDPDPRDAVIAKDAEVITELQADAGAKDSLIIQLTVSRDQWKSAYEAENRRAVGLQIALDAQKVVSKSDKWLGRIQGFAVGVAVGYAGGKL
jgi:hypothetical protein